MHDRQPHLFLARQRAPGCIASIHLTWTEFPLAGPIGKGLEFDHVKARALLIFCSQASNSCSQRIPSNTPRLFGFSSFLLSLQIFPHATHMACFAEFMRLTNILAPGRASAAGQPAADEKDYCVPSRPCHAIEMSGR
jgi:hypothetical protein